MSNVVQTASPSKGPGATPPTDSPPKALLKGRISDQQARIDDLSCRIGDFDSRSFLKDHEDLAQAECDLFDVELVLQRDSPTEDQYRQVCATLKAVQLSLDRMHQKLAGRIRDWERRLSVYAVFLLFLAATLGYCLYIDKGASDAWPFRGHPGAWPLVRLALLACSGALLGGASDLMRILSVVLANKSLDPRRILWYFLFPLASAALAGAFYLLIQAGTGFSALGTGKTVAGAAGVFGLGFLIGFVPTAVIYRINQVVKAFFGTDEVGAPEVAPPQVIRISNSKNGARLRVTTRIQSSDATRIVSAVARLQISGQTQAPGGTASAVLRRGLDNGWVGEVLVPPSKSPGDGSTTSDEGKGTLTVEARDDAGSIGRSEPVSLPPLQNEEDAGSNVVSDQSASSSSASSSSSSGSSSSGSSSSSGGS